MLWFEKKLLHISFFSRNAIINLSKRGGCSNTNACLVGALIGCRYGYRQLPKEWIEGLRKKQTDWLNIKINTLLDMMGIP